MALPAPDIVQPSGPVMGGPEAPTFSPHEGDHGGSLFNHPSTNRGGSPGILNGRGGIGSPVFNGGNRGRATSPFRPHYNGPRRVDVTVPSRVGRRVDATKPPNIGPTGAPRRAGGPSY